MRHRAFVIVIFFAWLVGSAKASAGTNVLISSISPDSLPGWAPFKREQDEALAIAVTYLSALDRGSYSEAYLMLADSLRASVTVSAFEASEKAFYTKAGLVVERRSTAMTWTKHPEGTSNPGTFAIIDSTDRFANIDRACSYLVLVKTDDGSGMKVLRSQIGSMDNATALAISARGSPGAVERAWRALSRQYPHCPA